MLTLRRKFLFLLSANLLLLCCWHKASGQVTERNQWKGERSAFVWNPDGTLSISPTTNRENATILLPYEYHGETIEWHMRAHFLDVPTPKNGFEWELFSYIFSDKLHRYLVTHGANGRDLLLLQEVYEGSSGHYQLANTIRLGRIQMKYPGLSWQDLQITVHYQEEGILTLTAIDQNGSLGLITHQVEPPKRAEMRQEMRLKAFFTKHKREILRWGRLEVLTDFKPDTVPVEWLSVEGISDSDMKITFASAVDASKATGKVLQDDSFSVTVEQGATQEEVVVAVKPSFRIGETYTLQIENLINLLTGSSFPISLTFTVQSDEVPPPSGRGALLISELMPDPSGNSAIGPVEYIELFNPSRGTVALQDYSLEYNGKGYQLPHISVPAHTFVVLYKKGLAPKVKESSCLVPMEKFPTLHNTQFELKLLESTSQKVIDEVLFTHQLYGPSAKKKGVSVERLNIQLPTSTPQWRASQDPRGGTPGLPPKQLPYSGIEKGAVVINEVLGSPVSGGEAFLELYNASSQPVDIRNLILEVSTDPQGDHAKSYALSDTVLLLAPKSFLVLTRYIPSITSFYPQTDPKTLLEKMDLPSLTSSLMVIRLVSQDNFQVVDQMMYRKQYLGINPKPPTGTSLERRSPELPGMESSSWRAALATAGKATPGLPNSVLGLPPIDHENPAPAWPTQWQLPFADIERLAQAYPEQSKGYIYSLMGHTLHQAEGSSLLTLLESIKMGENALSLPIGIYIFYIEVEGPEEHPSVNGSMKWLVH